jgi:EAL domain-containing protein (putative c-di-GMP-specific phosphodiesterase class I)
VALGDSLGMTTTAEGVETEAQLAELRGQGCTDAQGYLFIKPVPAEVARLLVAGHVIAAA